MGKLKEKLLDFLARLMMRDIKVESWMATGKELSETTRPPASARPGSFEASSPAGDTIKGIKITVPLPERRKDE